MTNITPQPGYILTERYIDTTKVFKPLSEEAGEDMISTVLAVGDSVIDSNNVLRETNVKVGDVIVHTWSNKEVVLDNVKYRFAHFTEIHGVIK